MAGKSLKRLRRLYRSSFGDKITLDHLIPKSRIPKSQKSFKNDEFNIFPFEQNRHEAWHSLFWNMTIFEIWESLNQIHNLIFRFRQEKICPVWLNVCRVENETVQNIVIFEEKKTRLLTELFQTNYLQKKWLHCFKGKDIKAARNFLKYKMFFMIFGRKMADRKYLLSDDNFQKMILQAASRPIRKRTILYCFGSEAISLSGAKIIFNEVMSDISRR